MSISLRDIFGYQIHATDGELGKITDVYFDDREWKVRYFVVELGPWFNRDKVILSPLSVQKVDSFLCRIDVSLDKEQVLNSPSVDTKKTVTMEMEAKTLNYYRWPLYWTDVGVWGTSANYFANISNPAKNTCPSVNQPRSHLRSTREVIGYFVLSTERKFGKVEDIIVDKNSWAIDAFVTKTKRWLPSKSVLLKTKSLKSISWQNGEFLTSLSYDQICELPKYHRNHTSRHSLNQDFNL